MNEKMVFHRCMGLEESKTPYFRKLKKFHIISGKPSYHFLKMNNFLTTQPILNILTAYNTTILLLFSKSIINFII